jgi:hypothetical protein
MKPEGSLLCSYRAVAFLRSNSRLDIKTLGKGKAVPVTGREGP